MEYDTVRCVTKGGGDVQTQNGKDIESLSPKCLPPCTTHRFPVRHSSCLALTAFSGKAFLSLTPQSCAPKLCSDGSPCGSAPIRTVFAVCHPQQCHSGLLMGSPPSWKLQVKINSLPQSLCRPFVSLSSLPSVTHAPKEKACKRCIKWGFNYPLPFPKSQRK